MRVLVEMLEPYNGRVYDPCCGSGGMFVQSEKFVEAHGGAKSDISIFGQESNPTTWRLAHMNLAIRGIEANLGAQPADTFLRDLHPDLKADYILANPPFNVSDWSGQILRGDVRWKLRDPPVGNANYAWIQHFIHHLAPPTGAAAAWPGFVMANGSLSSNTGGEGEIRRKHRRGRLGGLHRRAAGTTFLHHRHSRLPLVPDAATRRAKIHKGAPERPGGRKGETLFIDARKIGTLETRTLRVLSGDVEGDVPPDSDTGRIVYAFRRWRGEPKPPTWDEAKHGPWAYADEPGFCKAAPLTEIEKHGFVLTPGPYVGAEEAEDDDEPFEVKYPRLLAELEEQLAEGERLTAVVKKKLGGISDGS